MTDKKHTTSDWLSLAFSTLGVGYLPLAPGTWGSMVGVAVYVAAAWLSFEYQGLIGGLACFAIVAFLMTALCIVSFLASKRTAELMDGKDPQIVVVDEFAGQLLTFAFISFTLSWPLILTGFILFRVFDIWKPYPIKHFEEIPDGIGIVADDLVAGVYAGVVLSVFKVVIGL